MKKKNLYFILLHISCFILWTGCTSDSESSLSDANGGDGKGGSMARFTICGDYLYTVDYSTLKMFDISTAEKPKYLNSKDQYLNFGVETIFTMDTLLFIGSQIGMYVYNISRPEFPQQMSYVSHITSCDPVIASGNYAYVTLNSENIWCGRSSNVLQIYDISDPSNPELIKEQTGFRHPRGLGIDNKKLFICDNGLKVFDLDDPEQPVWVDDFTHIPEASGIDTYDVIPLNGLLLLIGSDGLYQFDYTNDKLTLVSKIEVSK